LKFIAWDERGEKRMIRLVKFLTIVILAFGLFSGLGTTNADASTVSQSSYKLTAYNSKGIKVNVNTSKDLVVTKVSGMSWYKGTLKYTSYQKVKGKWIKGTKTATIYVPSSKVKKYTTSTSKWVKETGTLEDAYFNVGEKNLQTMPKGSSIYKSAKENAYLYVQDSNGKTVIAKTIETEDVYVDSYEVYDDFDKDGIEDKDDNDVDGDGINNYYDTYGNNGDYDNDNDGIIDNIEYYYYQDADNDGIVNIDDEDYNYSNFDTITLDNDVDNDGIANDVDEGFVTKWNKFGETYYVSYVDYDKQTTTKSVYKTASSTQAYTKIYVAPKPGITLSRYNNIKIGMTYNQVVAITHDKGILISSYSSSRTNYEQYEFRQDNDEYKYAFISFVNGKVKSKIEADLY
jgi:hypothetical protein